MCPYCEGSIPLQAQECKYCGSSLVKKARASSAYQTEDSLASLYEPPYAPAKKTFSHGIPEQEALTRSYAEEEENTDSLSIRPAPTRRIPKKAKQPSNDSEMLAEDEDEESSQIGSLLLLSLGGHLFTLAWLLFFFSDHGKLVLEWKSRYWFIYFLLSLPLLYKGWKKLSEA